MALIKTRNTCPYCKSKNTKKDGTYYSKHRDKTRQKYKCLNCGKKYSTTTGTTLQYDKQGEHLKQDLRNILKFDALNFRWRSNLSFLTKMKVTKKTFYRVCEILSNETQEEFRKDDVVNWRGIKVVFNRTKEKKSAKIVFGFDKDGRIVFVKIGDFEKGLEGFVDRRISDLFPRIFNVRSKEGLLQRGILFSIYFNKTKK